MAKPGDAGRVVGGEDRDDVRVRQLRGRLRLAQEALADAGAERQLGREHLDRDAAVQPDLARAVDHGHAAAPDLASIS